MHISLYKVTASITCVDFVLLKVNICYIINTTQVVTFYKHIIICKCPCDQ